MFEPPPSTRTIEDSANALGVRIIGVPQQDEDQDDEFVLWPCNETAFSLFCALADQWRTDAFGSRISIDNSAIMPTAKLKGIKKCEVRECFDDLKTMQYAALEYFAEQSKS